MKIANKIVGLLVVAGLLGSTLAFAEKTHFNLSSQQFSKTLNTDDKMALARYQLTDSYATTNLLVRDGAYQTLTDAGVFNVELKKSLIKWGASFDINYYRYSGDDDTRSIKLVSGGGDALIVTITNGSVVFNGKTVYKPETPARLTIAFNKVDSNVKLTINGIVTSSVAAPNFTSLKAVNVQLTHDYNFGDRLNDLIIGER